MALITCPECGKEISDRSACCVHCGYPLPPKPPEPNRFSVVLTSPPHYPENRKRMALALVKELDLSEKDAMDLMDSAEQKPVVLRSEMTVESARVFANTLQRAGAYVKVVDGSSPDSPEASMSSSALAKERHGLGFCGTVVAVVVGVLAAHLIMALLGGLF